MNQTQKEFLADLNEVIVKYSKREDFSYIDGLGCLKLMSDELSSKVRMPFNLDDDFTSG